MAFIHALTGWLTPGRRQAIQALGATVVVALQSVGFITEGQGEAVTNLIAGVLAFLIAILALWNLSADQVATWLSTSLRGTVYALAALAGAAAVAFGLSTDTQVAQILAALSAVLTVVQAIVAVVNAPTTIEVPEAEAGEPTGIDTAGQGESAA